MRKSGIALMICIIILFAGCAKSAGPGTPDDARENYLNMSGCAMRAVVSCEQDGILWESELKCEYIPDGVCKIEILSPESIAGIRAELDSGTWVLRYEGAVLNAGTLSREEISPAAALPYLMDAIRNGWLIAESAENLDDIPCTRLTFDQDGTRTDKIYSTLWLRRDSGIPIRGEIMVDNMTILTVDFTDFAFDTPDNII